MSAPKVLISVTSYARTLTALTLAAAGQDTPWTLTAIAAAVRASSLTS